eukprot:641636-Pelagomonas_calceolata.AAC.14
MKAFCLIACQSNTIPFLSQHDPQAPTPRHERRHRHPKVVHTPTPSPTSASHCLGPPHPPTPRVALPPPTPAAHWAARAPRPSRSLPWSHTVLGDHTQHYGLPLWVGGGLAQKERYSLRQHGRLLHLACAWFEPQRHRVLAALLPAAAAAAAAV